MASFYMCPIADDQDDATLKLTVKNMMNVLSDPEVGFAASDWEALGLQLVEVHEKENIRCELFSASGNFCAQLRNYWCKARNLEFIRVSRL